jgi:hypothetical protein
MIWKTWTAIIDICEPNMGLFPFGQASIALYGLSARTQVAEQAASNSATSFAHFRRASLSFLIPSRMSFRSRQAKKASLPSQQRARLVRSGAMRPPSEALLESPEDQGSQPMLCGCYSVSWGVFKEPVGRLEKTSCARRSERAWIGAVRGHAGGNGSVSRCSSLLPRAGRCQDC